jgi:hypothetical protein
VYYNNFNRFVLKIKKSKKNILIYFLIKITFKKFITPQYHLTLNLPWDRVRNKVFSDGGI